MPRVSRLWTLHLCLGGVRRCHVSHGPSWAVEIKKCLVATICSKASVFLRHARTLSRCLQNMRADRVIMTYKPCR
jgi:hypothetical protein